MREKRGGGKRRGNIGDSKEGRDDTEKREEGEREEQGQGKER